VVLTSGACRTYLEPFTKILYHWYMMDFSESDYLNWDIAVYIFVYVTYFIFLLPTCFILYKILNKFFTKIIWAWRMFLSITIPTIAYLIFTYKGGPGTWEFIAPALLLIYLLIGIIHLNKRKSQRQ